MEIDSNIDGKKLEPKPGDYTLCLNCSLIHRYDDDLKLLRVKNEDLNKLRKEDYDLYYKLITLKVHIINGPSYLQLIK